MDTKFRHVVRDVIVHQNRVLIVRLKGAHSFLPGGGVEVGEGFKSAYGGNFKRNWALPPVTWADSTELLNCVT